MTMKLSTVIATAAMLAATAVFAAQDASEAWNDGALSALRVASRIKTAAALTFRGTGDIDGEANMFPCPIGPGSANGSTTGSAQVSGDIAVKSDDGKAHGVIHVTGTIWLDAFCSNGMSDSASGLGNVTGSGTVYGADGKPLGVLKVSGSASVSGPGMNVEGTADVKGSL